MNISHLEILCPLMNARLERKIMKIGLRLVIAQLVCLLQEEFNALL